MADILRAARDLSEHPRDQARRRALVWLWNSWSRSVGAEHLARALKRDMRVCAAFRDEIHASYRVYSEPTPRGKDVSVEIIVDNGLTHNASVLMAGTLVAQDVLPKVPGPGREPRDRSIVWGGGSDDQDVVGPHDIQFFRQNLTPTKKHLSLASTGGMSRIRPYVNAWDDETGRGCILPVPPAS